MKKKSGIPSNEKSVELVVGAPHPHSTGRIDVVVVVDDGIDKRHVLMHPIGCAELSESTM